MHEAQRLEAEKDSGGLGQNEISEVNKKHGLLCPEVQGTTWYDLVRLSIFLSWFSHITGVNPFIPSYQLEKNTDWCLRRHIFRACRSEGLNFVYHPPRSPKYFIKRRMGQKVFDFIRMGLRTGCSKISAGMLIWSH